jgi:SAM-dependent methyltransferase
MTSCVRSSPWPGRYRAAWLAFERFVHGLFGNNVVLGCHVVRQLERLGAIAPSGFTGRRVDDLGCGDGRVTVLLAEILQPLSLRGFDVNPALVRRAKSRGIEARVADLEDSVPIGELAVMWGVLHHLSDPARCLGRVRANYDRAFIREPIRGARPTCFELGRPMRRSELSDLLRRSLPGCQLFDYEDCVLAFWESRKTVGPKQPAAACASVVSARQGGR